MGADVKTEMKTRKRKEGAAVDGVKHGDTVSARVDHNPMRQTSCDNEHCTEPSALTICRDNALVDEGAEAPKPRLSPREMFTSTSVGRFLLAGTASTTMRTILFPPPLSWSLGEKTKNKGDRTQFDQRVFKAKSGVLSWRMVRSSTRLLISGRAACNVEVRARSNLVTLFALSRPHQCAGVENDSEA